MSEAPLTPLRWMVSPEVADELTPEMRKYLQTCSTWAGMLLINTVCHRGQMLELIEIGELMHEKMSGAIFSGTSEEGHNEKGK